MGGGTVRIMVFGTFSGLHRGHLNFFKQARNLAKGKGQPFLIVSVARDENVKKIKGEAPALGERRRLALVKSSALVDKVVLGGKGAHVPHIRREQPDIIALGYDQKAYVKNLKPLLAQAGLSVKVVRLAPYKPNIYKNPPLASRSRVL